MSDIVERLMDYTTCTDSDIDEAATEIARLREDLAAALKERDDVLIVLQQSSVGDPVEVAEDVVAENTSLREQNRVLREECRVHRDQYWLCGASASDDVREAIAATDAAKAMENE